ncbi:hypothetical protein JSY36_05850 [Bacillus sp. H-16]|uniref:hypothetical protein n=1 Tax=Alteribacter salitolerans TaxID=2912333 RepID=UPI001966A4AD|nr:hypothetical protein [Alteribacter salitolerans]MBM7095273.1 hypothetical protein [Alteribacter salitolerans]
MRKRFMKGGKRMSVMKARRVTRGRRGHLYPQVSGRHVISANRQVNDETCVLKKGASQQWRKETPLNEFKGVFSISTKICDEGIESAHKYYAQTIIDDRNR